jgi:hypothetical protein
LETGLAKEWEVKVVAVAAAFHIALLSAPGRIADAKL